MELLIVAAAAAAGYFANNPEKLPSDKYNVPGLSSGDSRNEKPETSSYLFQRLAQKRKLCKDFFPDKQQVSDEQLSDVFQQDGATSHELGSTGGIGYEMTQGLLTYSNINVLSLSSLPPELSKNGNLEEDDCGNGTGFNVRDDSGKPSTSQAVCVHDSSRSKNPLKTKHGRRHFVKPLNSIESCLVAQLCNDHTAMEDYVPSSLPSPSSRALRPLFVSDGTKIISRASRDFFNVYGGTENNKLHLASKLEKNEYLFDLPPQTNYSDFMKSMKIKKEKGQNRRYKMDSGKVFLKGSLDGTVLFCLGISMGLIASFLANTWEVEKLRELLKQTENLVQDLQEELEMKDSVTVKELTRENYQLQDRDHHTNHDGVPNSDSLGESMKNSTKQDGKESYYEKLDGGSESLSKIEAELEVELERLGLNMDAPSFDKRISDLLEVDPDFDADFAQGELIVDTKINGQAQPESESIEEKEGGSTSHYGNYAVSPRELSLRLHEVIQSRLEERVEELETALQNSQRKLKLMESGETDWKNFSNTEFRRFSTEESSLAQEDCDTKAQPLVINLSGEALDAYNEAYDELLKINGSEDEDSQSMYYANNIQEGPYLSEGNMSWGQNSATVSGSFPHLMDKKQDVSSEIFANQVTASEEHSSRFQELLDVGFRR